jgi:hypothetical protein
MKRILFSAFDAGGGNAIFPVVKTISKNKKFKVLCIVGGPSKEIFRKEKIDFIDGDGLKDEKLAFLVERSGLDLFVGGTGLGLTLDKKILLLAKEQKIKSICILDFWSNYSKRFSDKPGDLKFLPDIVCVMDKIAKDEMIREGFSSGTIKITGNPYFEHFQKKIKKGKGRRSEILFVSQPYSEIKNDLGYNEFEVLDDILGALGDLPFSYKVIIRTHPAEDKNKFKCYLSRENRVEVDEEAPIEDLVSRAGLVVGMTSMVLFQAALAGKKVISYQPGFKGKDILITNKLGLSKLITKRS